MTTPLLDTLTKEFALALRSPARTAQLLGIRLNGKWSTPDCYQRDGW